MASDRDELARTATALVGGSGAATAAPAEGPGATLGRYRLERELGAGGMGVVHAAFDPDLERRIALKVLRVSAPSLEAKDRLMREARAMARLSHPNVVTVHEVGTAHGRDFVAMELIHGETLADWVRAAKRPAAQVIDAFVAAGRGVAAAHAAGIVHRDFKPHNVLRSRDGRIVVTDFGLAREVEGQVPVALDATLPLGSAPATAQSTPSSLAGITVTGSLLGTPAYMAPEQWSHGQVTPATDQFAYCVALWEALAGERPYAGPTLDDLRAQVARGPDALDASRIPRRLRRILRRGLDPAPGKRWPSMDALLGQLVRAQRRPVIAIAVAMAAAAIAIVSVAVLRAGAPVVAACAAPARDPGAVWSPAIAAELLRRGHVDQVRVLAGAVHRWHAARAEVCHAPAQVQPAQLQCLDSVLARLDAVRQGYTRRPEPTVDALAGQLIDPALCQKPPAELPRLTLAPTPEVIAAFELYGRAETEAETRPTDAEIDALFARAAGDPCARVIATLAIDAGSKDRPRARASMSEATTVVDQCGDDRLRADLLLAAAPYAWELPILGPKGLAAIRLAQTAAARVMQPDVAASVALLQHFAARYSQRSDEALQRLDEAVALYAGLGQRLNEARAAMLRNYLRLNRATPDDLAGVARDVATYRPIVLAYHRPSYATQLDNQAALARLRRGDVAGGQADLMALWQAAPHDDVGRVVTGEVVDGTGRPVAGATVAASTMLAGNAVAVAQPLFGVDDSLRIATTDARGRFTLRGTAAVGPVVAQAGARRSDPIAIADRVRLVVKPTRTVRGRVELGGLPSTRLQVHCEMVGDPTGRYRIEAPIAADGSFTLEGASTGALRLAAALVENDLSGERVEYTTLPASPAPVTGLVLTLPSSDRTIDIVVRSQVAAPLDGAQVLLVPGRPRIANVNDLIRLQGSGIQGNFARPVVGESVPPAVIGKVRAGDLVAHVEHAAPGEITVCALAFTGDLLDPEARKRLQANVDKLALRCEVIGPTTSVIVVEVPLQQRLD